MQNFLEAIKQFFKGIFMNEDQKPSTITPEKIISPTVPSVEVEPTTTVGPKNGTITTPVAPKQSKLDLWCEAAKIMENARPILNNPGNIKYIGQSDAINNGGFCQFKTYAIGMQKLRDMFTNAATGKSEIYHPTDTLIQFYQKYAPSSDGNNPHNYGIFVANHIGVPITTEIKDLVI